jgi:hypothetical protein
VARHKAAAVMPLHTRRIQKLLLRLLPDQLMMMILGQVCSTHPLLWKQLMMVQPRDVLA